MIENKKELGGSFPEIIRLLNTSRRYRQLFSQAFGNSDTLITVYKITHAIARFERSFMLMNAPFDRYMEGDQSSLCINQIKGFNLFMGKAQCGTCHFVPLFSGLLPPEYKKTEFETLGTLSASDFSIPHLDPDSGRFSVTSIDFQKYGFKTPSVRNVSAHCILVK